MKNYRGIKILYILLAVAAFLPVLCGNAGIKSDERNTLKVYFGAECFFFSDELIVPTNHLVAEEIFDYKINASPQEKAAKVRELVRMGMPKSAAIKKCYPKIENFVNIIKQKTERPARDSDVIFDADNIPHFIVIRDKEGRKLNENAFYAKLFDAWQRSPDAVITLEFIPVKPNITTRDKCALMNLKSAYSTDYSSSGAARKHNIELAASKLNGQIVRNGGRFSFNGVVGKRTEQNGFQNAKIIKDGEYVDGIGGGVCQVSTTLYNAALLAGMSIDEAGSHSLPPSYVEPSFDAMVSFGSQDLSFTNDSGGDVFICAHCDGKKLRVEIYGLKNQYKITRKSVITQTFPLPEDKIIVDHEGKYVTPDMQSGEMIRVRGTIAGFQSEGYLIYSKDGKEVMRRKIREDRYLHIRGILAKKP